MALELDDDLRTPGGELRRDGDWTPPNEPTRAKGLWLIAALLVVAAGAAVYILYGDRSPATPAPVAATAPAAPPAETTAPSTVLGGEPYAVEVPSIDATDPLVRELLTKLSSHPRIAAWLATDGLVRSFTVVVLNVSEGKLPATAKGLTALRPTTRFRVVDRGGQTFIDPQSFDRYNATADSVASVDAAGSARLYATLRPRLEEAHRDLGASTASFDLAVERAIVRLLETPVVTTPMRVEPLTEGIGYGFVDPQLESLSNPQKQLLRMGPRNVRLIQAKLRETALALGIPASRLPPGE
jgi:Protein of unknown function (DUF3014)